MPQSTLPEGAPQAQLAAAISGALTQAVSEGALSAEASSSLSPASIPLERPKNREHGDYASSIALVLAKSAARPPRDIAQMIIDRLQGNSLISSAQIAGPGFINFTLAKASQGAIVTSILKEGRNFGKVKIGRAHV